MPHARNAMLINDAPVTIMMKTMATHPVPMGVLRLAGNPHACALPRLISRFQDHELTAASYCALHTGTYS